jgi:hypothetical protein
MDPAMWEIFEDGEPEDELRVIVRLAEGAEPPPELRVVSDFGEVKTARVKRKDVPAVWHDERVESLKAPRNVSRPDTSNEPEPLDEAAAELADAPDSGRGMYPAALGVEEDGSGVVVGFCDWGFDFTHPNFRNADGRTRLLSLWDQRQDRVFSRAEVDRALAAADPYAALGYDPTPDEQRDDGTHGTHVADIAVGNRREPGSRVGLAPGADIVFVHLANERFRELENLGDSVNLLEGLDFIRRVAAERPCVVSLSAGSLAGSHCGVSMVERAVDKLLEDGSLILVQSVGNYAESATHTHTRVGPNQHYTLDWLIPERDLTPNEVEIWYSGRDQLGLTLTAPTGQELAVPLDCRLRIELGGVHCGNIYHRKLEPNSKLNQVDCFLYPEAPAGCWRITLDGERVVDGRLHAWIERDGGRYQSRFRRQQATSLYTTNTICNSFFAIAVGAHDATKPERPPTRFSSRGPTADGRLKPELSAPGYRICAARSMPRGGWNGIRRLCEKSGTSMAAPHVAGAVALMLQAAGRKLTIHEVRNVLIGTVDAGNGPRGRSSTRIGYGYLNVRAAVDAARELRAGRQLVPAVPVELTQAAANDTALDILASRARIGRVRAEGFG